LNSILDEINCILTVSFRLASNQIVKDLPTRTAILFRNGSAAVAASKGFQATTQRISSLESTLKLGKLKNLKVTAEGASRLPGLYPMAD
jgi:hypothetical protein